MTPALTPANYRDIAEYLAIAQAELLATSYLANVRSPSGHGSHALTAHAAKAGRLRATILHALIAAGEAGS